MTRIYLIRHCEAYGNIHRRLDGIRDTDITTLGCTQISYLAERFRYIPIDAVYSSKLIRAVKTAAGIAEITGAAHFKVNDLHERKMGIFEGSSWHQVKSVYPEIFSEWQQHFDDYVIPEGESFLGAGARFTSCLDNICRENEGRTIAVVAHSMVIKAFLESIINVESIPFGNNTAVSCIDVEDLKLGYKPIYINDDSHLPEEMQIIRQRWAKGGSKLEDYSLRYEYEYDNESRCTILYGKKAFVKAYEHNNLVAYMSLCPGENLVEVENLYVFPEYRRLGFATQLIGEAIYSTKRLGYAKLMFNIPEFNDIFKGFIRKNGFLTMGNLAYILC